MSNTQDETFDVVVVGSGAAALATALGAVDSGLSAVLLESTDKWGGSSSISGGGMWLPNNPLMRRAGVGDSRDEALEYMEEIIGETGRATNRERKEAYVDGVDDFVLTAERHGMRFVRDTDYPDYYPELNGGKVGRAIESAPFDVTGLEEYMSTIRNQMPLPVKGDDVWLLARAWSSLGGFQRGAELVFRTLGGLVTRKKLRTLGAGLTAQFVKAAVVRGGASLRLNSPVEDLVVEDGRVVGVRVGGDGGGRVVRARRGVMLAAGGFDHNREMRREYQGVDGFPSGNPGNLGGPIKLAEGIGAALELMDDAWWGASLAPIEGADPIFLVGERSLPYSVMVDSTGARFANEAESYVDLGHRMLEHDREGAYWFIVDARYRLRYFRMFAMDPRFTKLQKEQGLVVEADSLEELSDKLGLDRSVFHDTIQRFNGFARSGRDQDFHRGDSAYDRYYGDPNVRPNACLGPVEKGPFTAYKVVIGDLGTKGGVVTDGEARALREDGSVIEGLYAAGNCSASVMGHTYPGPGATVGPAAVFGMRAARHMARSASDAS